MEWVVWHWWWYKDGRSLGLEILLQCNIWPSQIRTWRFLCILVWLDGLAWQLHTAWYPLPGVRILLKIIKFTEICFTIGVERYHYTPHWAHSVPTKKNINNEVIQSWHLSISWNGTKQPQQRIKPSNNDPLYILRYCVIKIELGKSHMSKLNSLEVLNRLMCSLARAKN